MRAALLALAALLAFSGCEETCATDAECQLPAVCGAEKRCVVPAPAADGAPCSHDQHCEGGACVFAGGSGTCATACDASATCPTGRCVPTVDARAEGSTLRLTCGPAGGDRYLAEACTTDESCRSGLCHDGHCTSPCGACPSTLACRPGTLTKDPLSLDTGLCTWWPVQPVLELGSIATPTAGGAQLSFELPAGAGAFTLVVEDFDDTVPAVTRLVAPDGAVFIGNPPADGGSADLARCSATPGIATVLVPGSDLSRAEPKPGRWTLEVVTYDPMGWPVTPMQVAGSIDRVAVVLKTPEPGGLVDLTLQVAPETGFLIGDGGMFIPTLLDTFDTFMRAKTGLALGQVRLKYLAADAGATVTTSAQARALWTEYAEDGVASRPVNVLLVDSLSFAGGVAGGNPGAPGVYHRPGSGVVIEPLGSGPQSTAVLLGHEVLHFVGLFHTSDGFQGADLISDTPSCPNPSGSSCADARNLMFPYFPTGEPLTVTAGQRQVLAGSPWSYHWIHPGACGAPDVVGLDAVPYTAGSTWHAPAALSGVCGGAGGERVHLVRLESGAQKLSATVRGTDFTPVLYLRRAECGPSGTEVACTVADGGGVATASVDNPQAGAYFVVVDSAADGGLFKLDVSVTP